jgi:RuvB-like protein 2
MIVITTPFSVDEMRQILSVRIEEEEVDMEDDALELLTTIAMETSLHYAIHMIITTLLVAQKCKHPKVELKDIERVFSLFVDVKRSTKFLMEYQSEFMYNELNGQDKKQTAIETGEEIEKAVPETIAAMEEG